MFEQSWNSRWRRRPIRRNIMLMKVNSRIIVHLCAYVLDVALHFQGEFRGFWVHGFRGINYSVTRCDVKNLIPRLFAVLMYRWVALDLLKDLLRLRRYVHVSSLFQTYWLFFFWYDSALYSLSSVKFAATCSSPCYLCVWARARVRLCRVVWWWWKVFCLDGQLWMTIKCLYSVLCSIPESKTVHRQ